MTEEKILIVEDEEKIRNILEKNLARHYSASAVKSFGELESLLANATFPYDVALLDRMMDGRDTLQLIPQVKSKFPQCKIIILSAINTPSEKAAALDLGADDYVSKPFELEELAARIRAVARRVSNEIRFGNIVVDTVERTVKVGQESVVLSTKEFLLLKLFMQSPGKVFNKEVLNQSIWQMSSDVESNAIETAVNKLRRKLEEFRSVPQIRNSRKLGYWFAE